MDKLSAMKAFVRVIEAGTFTKAADSIGMPKGQLSRLIQSLEQTLRTPLLNRSTRRVIATPDGAAYYECVVRLLDEMEDLETRISRATVFPRGKLRVGTPSEIANGILLPGIDDFCGRYPDIEIDITVGDRPVDILGENIDCALHIGRVTDSSLVARKVGEIRRILCASTTYLERYGVPQSPSDIENGQHRVISYILKGCVRYQYALQCSDERCDLVATSTIAVDDGHAMVSAALAGLGMAVVSMFMAAPHLANHTLHHVLPDWHASALPLHIVFPPNRRMNAKLRVFIDWIAELLAQTLTTLPAQEMIASRPDLVEKTIIKLVV